MPNNYAQRLEKLQSMEPTELLLHWMTERHKIYQRRIMEKLPGPWTDDPVLRSYRFCNVYRELDKVTIWIRENWREPYYAHENLWFAMAMARQINLPETLEAIKFPKVWNATTAHYVKEILEDRLKRKIKVYNGAYILGIIGQKAKGLGKPAVTIDYILKELWDQRNDWRTPMVSAPYNLGTLEGACGWFMQFSGFAGFMAYEVVSDLRWTRYLCHARDILTWANAGPGAKRGLNRLYHREVDKALTASKALEEMRTLHKKVVKYRDRDILDLPIEMREIEHSLCEVDKYMRAYTALAAGQAVSLSGFASPRRRMFS